ncbi:hypothetical protein SAMN06265360_11727 [Haloechinothrix alba]|uniref:Uncharacterized protein n=1 Tax=Haloechinothrix alba TaxID=664784 RepID=A0A238YT76_9PSEU|nr:hypothetical protein [Haloechinothrix alba]SNR74337.1 hypothetical protein SAMN06265360_11727 [Haloechinothrix alba]
MHHRIPATLVSAGALAPASAAVSPAHGSEPAEGRDSAVGAGTSTFPITGGPVDYAFAAHSDPSGAAPGGYFRGETDVDGDDPNTRVSYERIESGNITVRDAELR